MHRIIPEYDYDIELQPQTIHWLIQPFQKIAR